MRRIGVHIFDDVEVLDFAGPFEVFSTASRLARRRGSEPPFEVLTIGAQPGPVTARGGLVVVPTASIGERPRLDVLVVPGGVMDRELASDEVIAWVQACSRTCEVVASVCTGAFVLAAAGLLDGHAVTTHWEDRDELRRLAPHAKVAEGVRWIDEGPIVTAAGISAGIDVSLHLVERFCGREIAEETAHQMEYTWREGT